ncbi:MAG: phenylpyruvate tautomerase MIF-related protein [Gammaproteobacteria bacterium]|nr:phenylpyruvate tautomerase MIF-related protein [Gammaproteobacteria bacterium]
MPLMKMECNIKIEAIQKNSLLQKMSDLTSRILGKPESYVMCILEDGKNMSFAGNSEPACYVEFKSLGLPEDKTQDLSKAICEQISENIGITSGRIYIEFSNAQRHLWGWNNGTF